MGLHIQLLGPFVVTLDGNPLDETIWRSRQTRTILKILLVNPGAVVTTEQLLDYLWPNETESSARRRLHVRISNLRRLLPQPSPILTVDGGYRFDTEADCVLDMVEFERFVENGRSHQERNDPSQAITAYENARLCYKGAFLAEDLYESWTTVTRERLSELHLNCLIELADCYAQQGRYRRAISLAQHILSLEPAREAVYTRLMLYHYYAGERTQALDTFARCQQTLKAELDVAPLPNTIDIMRQIRAGTLWNAPDTPRYPPPIYQGRLFEVPYSLGNPPLVGREREYAWLVSQWQQPDTRLILLEGTAGIGKTHLLHTFIGFAQAQGIQVLHTRLSHEERQRYMPLVAGLQPLVDDALVSNLSHADQAILSSLFPQMREQGDDVLSNLPPDLARLRLFEAVETLVASVLPDGGIWVLDDAHRASAASLELFGRLTKQVVILFAYRGEETAVSHPLRHVIPAKGETATLQLAPLPETAVANLLAKLSQEQLPTLANTVHAQSAGNPLYIIALLQHMFEEGLLYVDENGRWQQAEKRTPSLPLTIRQTIEVRLQRLNRPQRQTFDIATVLGGEFNFELLRTISQEPEDYLLDVLDFLIDSNLLTEPRTQGRQEFAITHDYYAEVAYDTLPAVRRRQLHQRTGAAIEQVYHADLSPHFAALAYHFGQAQNLDCERHYARLSGEQAAAQFANEEALAHLNRALALTPPEEIATQFKLLSTREKVQDLMGNREAQQQDLQAMSALSTHFNLTQQAELSLRQATYAWAISDFPQTITLAKETIQRAEQCGATAVEAAAYLLWGKVDMDQASARITLAKAQQLAQQANLRSMEGSIVRCLGNACFWQGNYDECQRYFDEAVLIHREVGDQRGELSVLNNLGYLAHLQGDLVTAVTDYENALHIAQKIGDRLGEGVLTTNLGNLNISLGHFEEAQRYCEQALTLRQTVNDQEGVGVVLQFLATIARHQKNYATAEALCQQSMGLLKETNERVYSDTVDILGLIQLDKGAYQQAQRSFEQALDIMISTQSPDVCREYAHLGQLYYQQGAYEEARHYSQQALTQSENDGQVRAAALTTLGHTYYALGQIPEAQLAYQQALALREKMSQHHLTPELITALTRCTPSP